MNQVQEKRTIRAPHFQLGAAFLGQQFRAFVPLVIIGTVEFLPEILWWSRIAKERDQRILEWFALGLKSLLWMGRATLSQVVPSNLASDANDFPGVHSKDVTLELQLQDNGNRDIFHPTSLKFGFLIFFPSGKKIILKNAASFFFFFLSGE